MLQEYPLATPISAERAASDPAVLRGGGRLHAMEAVRVLPLLSAAECEEVIAEAEAFAESVGGWQTDRHVAYPTTDIPIRKLPRLEARWNTSLFPSVESEARERLGLGPSTTVVPLDVFVVKYSALEAGGQRELAVHRDNGVLTFSLLLNPPEQFEGGGTYFERAGAVYRPSQGVGVLHSALVRHAGYPITAGVRYVLVGFCSLRSPLLAPGFDRWRFGEDPPWFVSSRVVSDGQILRRVWPSSAHVPLVGGSAQVDKIEHPADATSDPGAAHLEATSEHSTPEAAISTSADANEVVRGTGTSARPGEGEKPWYRAQHDAAAAAREEGELVCSTATAVAGWSYELWRNGADLVALLISDANADGQAAVIGSLTFREGPLSPDMSALLGRLLPPPRRHPAAALLRSLLPLRRREAMAGVVHVYVEPEARGGGGGHMLVEESLRRLRSLGFSHVLTLADDRGSGKLREWYEDLGFVDASAFSDTAMVARTVRAT